MKIKEYLKNYNKEKIENYIDKLICSEDKSNILQIEKIYNVIEKHMKKMRIEFKKDILNDEMIYKSIKDSKTINRYSNIFIAGNIIAGIDLRNLQRSNNNLDGEIEEYPYNERQIETIDKFMELNSLQEKIEEYVEVSQKEFEI